MLVWSIKEVGVECSLHLKIKDTKAIIDSLVNKPLLQQSLEALQKGIVCYPTSC